MQAVTHSQSASGRRAQGKKAKSGKGKSGSSLEPIPRGRNILLDRVPQSLTGRNFHLRGR